MCAVTFLIITKSKARRERDLKIVTIHPKSRGKFFRQSTDQHTQSFERNNQPIDQHKTCNIKQSPQETSTFHRFFHSNLLRSRDILSHYSQVLLGKILSQLLALQLAWGSLLPSQPHALLQNGATGSNVFFLFTTLPRLRACVSHSFRDRYQRWWSARHCLDFLRARLRDSEAFLCPGGPRGYHVRSPQGRSFHGMITQVQPTCMASHDSVLFVHADFVAVSVRPGTNETDEGNACTLQHGSGWGKRHRLPEQVHFENLPL